MTAYCGMAGVEIPRESVEFVPLYVYLDDVQTQAFEVAVSSVGQRPTVWAPATTFGTDAGVLISGLVPGRYQIWTRVSVPPESIVVQAGTVRVT